MEYPKFTFVNTPDPTIEAEIEADHKKAYDSLPQEEKDRQKRDSDLCVKLSELVFDAMRREGYEPYDIERGNGYFIFDLLANSVVYFRIKGLFMHNYQFGMWIHTKNMEEPSEDEKRKPGFKDYDVVIEIFQQHKDYIDKFKPSCSSPVIEVNRYVVKDLLEVPGRASHFLHFSALFDLLHYMKFHPFMHFVNGAGFKLYQTECFSFCFWHYLVERARFHFSRIKENALFRFHRWNIFRKLRKGSLSPFVEEVIVTDFNATHPGLSTSYRYEIAIRFSKDSTIQQCSDWFDRYVGGHEIGNEEKYGYNSVAQLTSMVHGERGKHYSDSFNPSSWCSVKEGRERVMTCYKHYYGVDGFFKQGADKYKTFVEYLGRFGFVVKEGTVYAVRSLVPASEKNGMDYGDEKFVFKKICKLPQPPKEVKSA